MAFGGRLFRGDEIARIELSWTGLLTYETQEMFTLCKTKMTVLTKSPAELAPWAQASSLPNQGKQELLFKPTKLTETSRTRKISQTQGQLNPTYSLTAWSSKAPTGRRSWSKIAIWLKNGKSWERIQRKMEALQASCYPHTGTGWLNDSMHSCHDLNLLKATIAMWIPFGPLFQAYSRGMIQGREFWETQFSLAKVTYGNVTTLLRGTPCKKVCEPSSEEMTPALESPFSTLFLPAFLISSSAFPTSICESQNIKWLAAF